MIHWPVSLRLRMAVAFTLIVGATLALVGLLTYQLLKQNLLSEIEQDVAQRASTFASAAPAPPYDLDTFGAPDVFLQVSDVDGEPLARSGNLGGKTLPVTGVESGQVAEIRLADRPLFLTWAPIDSERRIVVARSPVTTYGALGSLRQLLAFVIGGAVVLTSLTSWLYARAALRPIGHVVDAARAVRDGRDLSRRVEPRGTQDEVGRLVQTFNEMVAELDDAYRSLDSSNQRLRQFLADCSHELRAPLARIRGTVDLLGRIEEPGHSADAFRSRALADVAADTDRMARMVRQLLILARADAGASIEPRPVRLDEVVEHACRQAARMADGVGFRVLPPGTLADELVQGDADLLEQLLLILLDNAFKYTPGTGEVSVTAERTANAAQITVSDSGLGVPPEDAERIFERFYRGRNASTATGTGLGLAIAAWIAAQHGGHVEHAPAPGGESQSSRSTFRSAPHRFVAVRRGKESRRTSRTARSDRRCHSPLGRERWPAGKTHRKVLKMGFLHQQLLSHPQRTAPMASTNRPIKANSRYSDRAPTAARFMAFTIRPGIMDRLHLQTASSPAWSRSAASCWRCPATWRWWHRHRARARVAAGHAALGEGIRDRRRRRGAGGCRRHVDLWRRPRPWSSPARRRPARWGRGTAGARG